ncbi:MAG: TetR/AcrR family transcriptional regulator [Candidatus Tectimicrobiota bacterium]
MQTKTLLRVQAQSQIRQAILEAARALISTEGYKGLSMRRLAQDVGYTPKTIYRYFTDKDDLLSELLEEDLGHLVTYLEEVAASQTDPAQRLDAVALAYVTYGIAHPHAYQVMFLLREHPLSREAATRHHHIQGRRLQDLLACVLSDSGRMPKTLDEPFVVQALRCALHGVVALRLVRPQADWPDLEALVSHLVAGVVHESLP